MAERLTTSKELASRRHQKVVGSTPTSVKIDFFRLHTNFFTVVGWVVKPYSMQITLPPSTNHAKAVWLNGRAFDYDCGVPPQTSKGRRFDPYLGQHDFFLITGGVILLFFFCSLVIGVLKLK